MENNNIKFINCSYFFLFTLVFLGCGDEPSSEDEVVKHLVEDELVFDTEPGKCLNFRLKLSTLVFGHTKSCCNWFYKNSLKVCPSLSTVL